MLPLGVGAQSQSFSDVAPNSPLFSAVEYLRAMQVMRGYDDGTFKPDQKVNRAEAVKIIVSSLATDGELKQFTKSTYADVPADAWFFPYVEFARQKLGIIDGPPAQTSFKPADPVLKAQLLKMFYVANGIDSQSLYSEVKLPFSEDVRDASQWYYPHMRYSLASSMVVSDSYGELNPEKALSRGDIALLLHRYYLYRDGKRTQTLLTQAAAELEPILKLLDQKKVDEAEFAASRSLMAARGALTRTPDEAIVKGAVKTSEAFQTLVLAYRANEAKKYDDAVKYAGDAWQLAQKAREFSSGLGTVASQLQTVAKNMADTARAAKK